MVNTNPLTAIGNYYKDIQDVEGMMPNQVQKIPMPPTRKQSASQMPKVIAKPNNTVEQLLAKLGKVKKTPAMTEAVGGFKNLPVMAGAPKKSFGDLQRESIQRAILAHFNGYGE